MNDLQHFLQTATRGLWGKRKLEVQEELEAHVLERAHKHELLGLARKDAISKSMQELGNAQVMNRDFIMLQTRPLVPMLLLIATAFLALGTLKPVSADRLKPSFELQCVNTNGRQSAFEFRPSKYWKNLNNLEMARAIKPVLDNWGNWGKRMQHFENRIGANLTMASTSDLKVAGNLVLVTGSNLENDQRIRKQSQAVITCKTHKIGDLENLHELRKMLPGIQRQFAQLKTPGKK
jgi:hypothetical protein